MLWVPSEPHAVNKVKLVVLIKGSHLKRVNGKHCYPRPLNKKKMPLNKFHT